VRVLAIIATYNEDRFIGGCIEHLASQGVAVYLCDNESTDRTAAIAAAQLGGAVRGVERIPRDGIYRWREILRRKEEVAAELDADWYLHVDADERPLAPRAGETLAAALGRVDDAGYNAVEFSEFTFVPTLESPDHDHPEFVRTMQWYYPFAPTQPHLIRAWKQQRGRVDLASSGGHLVGFRDRRVSPELFRLRHYLFLSRDQAIRKYGGRSYDPEEVREGWHGWRPSLRPEALRLPSQAQLRRARSDDDLDPSGPRTEHCIAWGGR
jgi:glycosyltransferase involved in cell wall biosynthesis